METPISWLMARHGVASAKGPKWPSVCLFKIENLPVGCLSGCCRPAPPNTTSRSSCKSSSAPGLVFEGSRPELPVCHGARLHTAVFSRTLRFLHQSHPGNTRRGKMDLPTRTTKWDRLVCGRRADAAVAGWLKPTGFPPGSQHLSATLWSSLSCGLLWQGMLVERWSHLFVAMLPLLRCSHWLFLVGCRHCAQTLAPRMPETLAAT